MSDNPIDPIPQVKLQFSFIMPFLFEGNHACVAVINNFLPRSEIDYYTQPHGLETEPKLPPHLAAPLHKFILQVKF